MKTNIQFTNSKAKELYSGKLQYATEGSAGFDLMAVSFRNEDNPVIKNKIILKPDNIIKIGTGVKIQPLQGYATFVYARSGFSTKNETILLNGVGVIDNDYTGEIIVCLKNISNKLVAISLGDRIAQGVIMPVLQAEFEYVDGLEPTKRSEGGFGSTGK